MNLQNYHFLSKIFQNFFYFVIFCIFFENLQIENVNLIIIYYMTEVIELQQIEAQVKSTLKLPTDDPAFNKHIANILA